MLAQRVLFVPPQTDTFPTSLLFEYYQRLRLVENLSEKTVLNRKYILEPFFKSINTTSVQTISLYDIDTYSMESRDTKKASTVNIERQAFRSFFSFCQIYKLIELQFDYKNIRRSKEHPPRVVPLTQEQIVTVVRDCKHMQDKLIISVMYESGMRIGELLDLTLEDINGQQIRVRGKGSKDRIVCVPIELSKALFDYSTHRGYVSGHVFRPLQEARNRDNTRYASAYGVRDRIEREFTSHGIKMHPHLLRHSFAFHWLDSGGDLRSLQLLLGHSNMEITQRYLGLTDDYLRRVYDTVSPTSIIGLT